MKNFGAAYDASLIILAILFILASIYARHDGEIYATALVVCATALLISIRTNAFRDNK